MTRSHGRCRKGERLRMGFPHGHRKTTTLVAGLRMDRFSASYNTVTPSVASLDKSDTLWSPRLGALWQPTSSSSYYASYGTSYNGLVNLTPYWRSESW